MTDEIKKLSLLVDQFDKSFLSDAPDIKVYKEELQKHVEAGLGQKLAPVMGDSCQLQKQMIERMSALLPDKAKEHIRSLLFRQDFDLSSWLDKQHLFADFNENIEFQFSLGFTSLMNRFQVARAKFMENPSTVLWMEFVGVLILIVIGIFWKTVLKLLAGVVVVGGGLYFLLYTYEYLTWTNKAKERAFKQQFVQYASQKLEPLVNIIASYLSNQIKQGLSTTLACLCREIDTTCKNLKKKLLKLEQERLKLEGTMARAKVLRNKAGWLDSELDRYIRTYLQHRRDRPCGSQMHA